MRHLLSLIVVVSPAFAQGFLQNTDVSAMFGPATEPNVVISPPPGPGYGALVNQLSFGYQFLTLPNGSLLLEIPQTYVLQFAGNITFVTPGVRFKLPTATRFSPYAALGGGFGHFQTVASKVNGVLTTTSANTYRPALDFGGGVDFRVARWFSLRGEIRDFVTPHDLGGAAGHNHPVFLLGFAFHS